MIQIAVTDAVVCVIWLTLVAMQLATLPSLKELKDEFEEGTPIACVLFLKVKVIHDDI